MSKIKSNPLPKFKVRRACSNAILDGYYLAGKYPKFEEAFKRYRKSQGDLQRIKVKAVKYYELPIEVKIPEVK